jgi:hypothetical protein
MLPSVQQRLIIQMRDIEQYEFEEIAKILEMNESAIGWRYLEQGKRYGLYMKKHTIMESVKIDYLVEKYFQGETSIAEEKELRTYFSSSDVAQHLEQYRPILNISLAKEQQFTSQVPQPQKRET